MHRTNPIEYKMINKIAWSFHNTTGIEFEELRSEATLAYMEALQSYRNDKKMKITSWCYRIMQQKLIDFCKAEEKTVPQIYLEDIKDDLKNTFAYEAGTREDMEELLDSLPKTAKDYISIFIEKYDNLCNKAPRLVRGNINKGMREKGIKHQYIWDSRLAAEKYLTDICS